MVVLIWVPLMVNERFTSLSFKLDHTFFLKKKWYLLYFICKCSQWTEYFSHHNAEPFSAVKDYY